MRRGALRAPLLLAAVLVTVALARSCDSGGGSVEPAGPVSARVTHVVDGDTIDVRMPGGAEESVRYIGIDTPETVKPDTPVQCGGPEAHEANERLVGGRTVTLRFEVLLFRSKRTFTICSRPFAGHKQRDRGTRSPMRRIAHPRRVTRMSIASLALRPGPLCRARCRGVLACSREVELPSE